MHNRDRMLGIVSQIAFGKKARSRGFALPAVLLSGVILMAMLVISSSAASSVVSVTKTQYYNQLAREAAESGITFAGDCVMNDSENKARWSSTLTTGAACTGANSCTGANCYVAYFDGGKMRSSFSVTADKDSQDRPTRLVSRGKVELYRSSTNTVWKSFDVVVRAAPVRDPANVIDFSSGTGGYSCVVSNQRAYCYGYNGYGQVGRGDLVTPVTKPVPVVTTTMNGPIASIATGYQHSCAVMSTQADGRGDVYCWGRNNLGQLGIGNTTTQSSPVRVNNANLNGQTISVTAGPDHTCALTGTPGNAQAYCWGNNADGQLGVNSATASFNTPQPISTPGGYTGFVSLSAGASNAHMCGVAAVNGLNPRAFCWGDNTYGQVGNGNTTSPQRSPQLVGGDLNANVRSVVVGGGNANTNRGTSCAVLDTTSTGYCWGYNYMGYLGIVATSADDMTRIPVTTPTRLRQSTHPFSTTNNVIEKIVLGTAHGCALRTPWSNIGGFSRDQKSVICWGANTSGQLALDDLATDPDGDVLGPNALCSKFFPDPPSTAGPGETIHFAIKGKYRACISQPFEIFASRPGQPGGLYEEGITDLMASGIRTCIIAGGTFYCWGRNDVGQAGIGNTNPEFVRWPTRADLIENLRGYRFY